ncbi:Pancreatic lipase-related protein 2, partial [Stegodyphus mimosarum]
MVLNRVEVTLCYAIFQICLCLQCFQCLVLRLVQNGKTSTFNYTANGLTISLDDKEKCMPDIGCFSAGPPFFHPLNRPISLLPQDRDDVATAFLLYTRKNP